MATDRSAIRRKHHLRVRHKVTGTPERPRLCVFRSLKHVSAQLIDDVTRRTITAVSTMEPAIRGDLKCADNTEASRRVGLEMARRAAEKGVDKVVFDRGGYVYHGRVKALADAAREGGLKF
ncbi:MAG TPA: 50S ribosomal protein L18 [Armatimonadota bacterium]|nr:50S ribosomal protein L18 [Armatimonadota bacterium]